MPRDHVLSDLGFTVARSGPEILAGTAAVVAHMHVPGTAVLRASVLANYADTITGLLAVDVIGPRVPVTLQLDLNLYAPPEGLTRVHATARRVKVGKSVFVAAVDFSDQDGTPIAIATGQFMVAPDPEIRMPGGMNPLDVMSIEGGPLQIPLAERAGCTRERPGVAALPLRSDGLNASGTLNGGLTALVVEEAVLSAMPARTLSSMALLYLRPVRKGPAVAVAEIHRDVAEVTVRDEGRDAVAVYATTRVFPAGQG